MSFSLSSLAVAALVFGLTAGQMQSGADLTTRRVGDAIQYRMGCHTAEAMTRVMQGGEPYELWDKFFLEGKCFRLVTPTAAVLEKWLSGPYILSDLRTASVWQIRDQYGDVEFAAFLDLGGPHEAQRDAS